MQLQKRKPKGGQQTKKSPRQKKRGVLYIKHLPHGFFEEQLRGYFSQFGAITRLRLARSKRTLGSKGYAFIEFRYPEVAEIAADAMNNYLMFKNIIKTRFIPPTDIRHDYFRSSVTKVKKDGEKVFTSKSIAAREAVVQNTNKLMTAEDEQKRVSKIGSRINKAKQRLSALGIDYDVDEIAQNMGAEVMQAVENSKPKTITSVELASEDEADETFDPQNVDIDSEDEFEDFEYNSDHSDDDDGVEVSMNEVKLEEAVKVARKATKTATIPALPNDPKRKIAPAASPVPAKKQKAAKKGKENKQTEEVQPKPAKKAAEKPVKVAVPTPAPTKISKRNAAKKQAPVVEASKPEPKSKKSKAAAKTIDLPVVPKAKVEKAEAPAAAPKQKKGNKAVAKAPQPEAAPKQNAKGTKAQKPASLKNEQKPAPAKAPKKGKQTAVPQTSSPAPVKTKKLAKASAGIEKKKPAKVADKKLKLAAGLVSNGADIVKVVKGKEIKKKTKK